MNFYVLNRSTTTRFMLRWTACPENIRRIDHSVILLSYENEGEDKSKKITNQTDKRMKIQ